MTVVQRLFQLLFILAPIPLLFTLNEGTPHSQIIIPINTKQIVVMKRSLDVLHILFFQFIFLTALPLLSSQTQPDTASLILHESHQHDQLGITPETTETTTDKTLTTPDHINPPTPVDHVVQGISMDMMLVFIIDVV